MQRSAAGRSSRRARGVPNCHSLRDPLQALVCRDEDSAVAAALEALPGGAGAQGLEADPPWPPPALLDELLGGGCCCGEGRGRRGGTGGGRGLLAWLVGSALLAPLSTHLPAPCPPAPPPHLTPPHPDGLCGPLADRQRSGGGPFSTPDLTPDETAAAFAGAGLSPTQRDVRAIRRLVRRLVGAG
jgi:hypothetical protein